VIAHTTSSAYDARHAWPADVADAVALHLLAETPGARSALFLGAATGVNDALPFARLAPELRVIASDVDPDFLRVLSERAPANVEVRRIDARRMEDVEPADLVALFFVAHRIPEWRELAPAVAARVSKRLYVSEWAGGLVYLANEKGGSGPDPVARLLRRFHELRDGEAPELRTSRMSPFLEALHRELPWSGKRDFAWRRAVSVGDVLEAMEEGAWAPFRSGRPDLARLREEFAAEAGEGVELIETLRIHAFSRD
jgi:hypothetical protein